MDYRKERWKNYYSLNMKRKHHDIMVKNLKYHISELIRVNNGKYIFNKPIPDSIMVDFYNKKIYAIELSKRQSMTAKLKKYKNSDFDFVVFVKPENNKLLHPNYKGLSKATLKILAIEVNRISDFPKKNS